MAAVAVSLFHNTHDACSGYGFPRAQQHSVIGVWDEASAFLLSKLFPRPSSQVVPAKPVQRCSELISKEFCLTTRRHTNTNPRWVINLPATRRWTKTFPTIGADVWNVFLRIQILALEGYVAERFGRKEEEKSRSTGDAIVCMNRNRDFLAIFIHQSVFAFPLHSTALFVLHVHVCQCRPCPFRWWPLRQLWQDATEADARFGQVCAQVEEAGLQLPKKIYYIYNHPPPKKVQERGGTLPNLYFLRVFS